MQAVEVCDLLISTVKEIGISSFLKKDKRYTFQVIQPGQLFYELQSESEQDMKAWVKTIRDQIEGSLSQVSLDTPVKGGRATNNSEYITLTPSLVRDLRAANPLCVDCNAEGPGWASLNLCIMMCVECSGIHRSLGTHITKVRSLTLDKWTNNSVNLMFEIGNKRSNKIWEQRLSSEGVKKPTPDATREEREWFIADKYARKRFAPIMTPTVADAKLFKGAGNVNLLDMMEAIAASANINFKSPAHNQTTLQLLHYLNGDTPDPKINLCIELLKNFDASHDLLEMD